MFRLQQAQYLLTAYILLISFASLCALVDLTVNVNTSLTQFFDFCKSFVAEKACPVIYRFDISRRCINDPNSTTLSDLKCLFFVSVHLCIPVASFGAIFDQYLGMPGRFFYLHIVMFSSFSIISNAKMKFSHLNTCH